MLHRIDRRRFLQTTAVTGFWIAGTASAADEVKKKSPIEQLRIACIGVGGKGGSDTDQAGQVGEIVALCDIDEHRLDDKGKKFPKAKKYFDFRKLLEEMEKSIDAVVVSTPDHTHAPAAMMAMRMKKHVYCQKPLTHSVKEARLMRETAKAMGVCTQMGNQGTAENALRRAAELVQAGVIGPVRAVHVWTNRPVWPQAPKVMARPAEVAVPSHVHWDEFIGPAPMRPYAEYVTEETDKKSGEKKIVRKGAYHSFNWRGWWDFGTGALGDMACHTVNLPFMALKLGAPLSVVAQAGDLNPETCPSWANVVFQFPGRGDMPPVTLNWYEGNNKGKKLLPPEDLIAKVLRKGEKIKDSGSILVGDKGILYSPSDYGAEFRLCPEHDFDAAAKSVSESLPRNGKGDLGMKQEWAEAIRLNKPAHAMSNFDYAGMLTETILLGNCAIRTPDTLLEWDAASLRFPNSTAASALLHTEYRKGWTL